FCSLGGSAAFSDHAAISFGQLSHLFHHSLPVKEMHPFHLDLHFFFPPIRTAISVLAQFLISQVEFAGGFGEMSLQAVTKTNLAVKTRTRDRVGVSNQDLSAAEGITRFLVSPDQSQDIAKTFVQSQPAFTKLPVASTRDLPNRRFVESNSFRIGKGGFRSFGRSSQIKYCPLGRVRPLIMISQRSGEF